MATYNNKIEISNGNITDVFHPETNSGQVYDYTNQKWLSELIGTFSDLTTTQKTSLISAINEINAQGKALGTKTDNYMNIYEYKHLVPNVNAARSDWDWTAAFKQANLDASNNGKTIVLPREEFRVTDSFTTFGKKTNVYWKGNKSTILFVNTTVGKALVDLGPNTSSSIFESIVFRDSNTRTSTGVRISAYPMQGSYPNWKNRFVGCEFYNFKVGICFTTNADQFIGTQQDWSSENLFLHCKIKNCEIGILNQNLQALNNTFLQTDIENDASGEQFTLIRDEAGGGMFFYGCSLIGRGRVYEWYIKDGSTGLFPNAHINISGCRFEVRGGHIGELFYQDPTGKYSTNFSRLHISVTDCTFEMFGQGVDLIKYAGKVIGNFNNLNVNNGGLIVRNVPVEGISSAVGSGSVGKISVTNSTAIEYVLDTSITAYGNTNVRFAHHVDIDVVPATTSSMQTDSLGFTKLRHYSVQSSPLGLSIGTVKRLVYNEPQVTSGFTNLKLIVPKYAKLLKIGFWKQPVRFAEPTGFRLYLVKDAHLWATQGTFNEDTDGILVADTGSSENKAGLFEAPVQLTNNVLGFDMTSGFGSIWKEGRVYLKCYGYWTGQGGMVYIDYM